MSVAQIWTTFNMPQVWTGSVCCEWTHAQRVLLSTGNDDSQRGSWGWGGGPGNGNDYGGWPLPRTNGQQHRPLAPGKHRQWLGWVAVRVLKSVQYCFSVWCFWSLSLSSILSICWIWGCAFSSVCVPCVYSCPWWMLLSATQVFVVVCVMSYEK